MDNNYLFKTYMSKVFLRLRNKAQLFSSHTDDHFHTRLTHTLEVKAISIEIANRLNSKAKIKIDLEKITAIALLHDIGHTPFGHCGERTLCDILSGTSKIRGLPNFAKLEVSCGFKHNINSGFLYKENTPFSIIEFEIMDGIVKHSSIKNDGLDYGLDYITNMFQIPNNYFAIKGPCTNEGLIVAFSDEIAQICSDYCDAIVSNIFTHADFANVLPFSNVQYRENINQKNARKYINVVCDYLIELFVKAFLSGNNFENIDRSMFGETIKQFDDWRKDYLLKTSTIRKFDLKKRKIINKLFKFYYLHPKKMNSDALKLLSKRLRAIKVNRDFYKKYVNGLNEYNVLDFIKKYVKPIVYHPDRYKNISKNVIDDYRRLFEMYIRTVAIYISTMTDNYATKEYYKHCTNFICYKMYKMFKK